MKVLLRSDVDGLGRTGDIVEVARGYARNYLVPHGLAIEAIAGITAQADAMQRKREMQSVAERADA
ncbi:MAG: 50S ribosomal protein L9, partial [Acidimicrobiales bacterium]|nr:50S ribosomal protein L9 [Acidimicrobiales bacterium]